MKWFNKLGNMLDEMDGEGEDSAGGAESSTSPRPTESNDAVSQEDGEADVDGQGKAQRLGGALMGKGLGLLSSAASKASSALEKANEAVEKAGSAVDSIGSQATARLVTALGELNEDGSDAADPSDMKEAPEIAPSEDSPAASASASPPADSSSASAAPAPSVEASAAAVSEESGDRTETQLPVDIGIARAAQMSLVSTPPSSGSGEPDAEYLSGSAPIVDTSTEVLEPQRSNEPAKPPAFESVSSQDAEVAGQSLPELDLQSSGSRQVSSLADSWHLEDPAMSMQSASGRRSPTPSIGAASVTTSGAGTSEYIRVGEVPNLAPNMECMAAASSEAKTVPGVDAVAHGSSHAAMSPPASMSSSSNSLSRCASTPSETAAGERESVASPSGGNESVSLIEDVEPLDLDSEITPAEPGESGVSVKRLEADNAELRRLLQGARVEYSARTEASEAKLTSALQQIEELQSRLNEVDAESTRRFDELSRMRSQEAVAQLATEKAEAKLKDLGARLAESQKQADELKKDAEKAQRRAQASADKEKDAVIDEVRQEMEKELSSLLKKKDEQVHALERKVAEGDRLCKEQSRELDSLEGELKAAKAEAAAIGKSAEGKAGAHERKLDDLASEYQQNLSELEKRKREEELMKHELALSLRGVEERANAEISQLEAQKAQLELHAASLQEQLEAERQKCTELALSLGEAMQSPVIDFSAEEAQAAAEEEARTLRERLRLSEEKLADARSAKDSLAEEMESLRSEFKALTVERTRLESELSSSQNSVRELQAAARAKAAQGDGGASQQAVVEALQKDFNERMERNKDEVAYLRQKCDEKERRCEQLLAERSTLASELKAFREGGDAALWSNRDVEADKPAPRSGAPSRSLTRTLPLSAPSWLRNADEPLRMVVKILGGSPPARLVFFGYVIILHVWVLFVLQNAAMQGATSDHPLAPSVLVSMTPKPAAIQASSAAEASSSVNATATGFLAKTATS